MLPRLGPNRKVLRVLAWIAFWPLAYLASPTQPLVAGAFIVGALVSVLVPRTKWAIIGLGAVAVAVRAIEQPLMPRVAMLSVAGVLGIAYEWALLRTNVRDDDALDADARALLPFASWLALAGCVVTHATQALHMHAAFPMIAHVMLGGAVLGASLGVVSWLRLQRWAMRVHRGAIDHLRVRPTTDAVAAPRLADVAPLDAAIVEGANAPAGPYRAGEGRAVARVPLDRALLSRHLVLRAVAALLATVCCIAVATLAIRIPHDADLATTPSKLPPFPAECSARPPKLRFVALAPLHVLDVEDIADRYRRAGIADVTVAPALPFEDRFLDRDRGQVIGEEIIDAARRVHRPREDGALVVVVTDRDMFLRDVDWRYAFATRSSGIAVVSIARMDPNFPLLAPATYVPRRDECSATVRARTFRMVTRQVLLGLCFAETSEDPRSARRKSVLGLSDLDAIDEATY